LERGVIGPLGRQQNIDRSKHPLPDRRSFQVTVLQQRVVPHGNMDRCIGTMLPDEHPSRAVYVQLGYHSATYQADLQCDV
jgi:hypothetical protein